MQADVILKEPPPWVPPLSLSGGARVEGGGGGARPPLVRPCQRTERFGKNLIEGRALHQEKIVQ